MIGIDLTKDMKRILGAILAAALLFPAASCGKDSPSSAENENTTTEDNSGKEGEGKEDKDATPSGEGTLVVYYSYTGNCKAIVDVIMDEIEADLLEIRPAEEGLKYEADNYKIGSELISKIRSKPGDSSSYPKIKTVDKDVKEYASIIIVTPLWWSNMAAIMQSYLFSSGADMAGKKIGLIVSSSSSGISEVTKDAKRLIPEGDFVKESLWIKDSNRSKKAQLIKEWLQ